MKILHQQPVSQAEVSVVLVDWSVRESLHSIDYLNDQSVSREPSNAHA